MLKPARITNLILGIWLFISAFVWSHTMSQQTNTWIMGLLIAGAAAWAMADSRLRYLNTIFSIWLFISVWVLPWHNAATFWNNIIIAIIVFVLSLVPTRPPGRFEEQPLAP